MAQWSKNVNQLLLWKDDVYRLDDRYSSFIDHELLGWIDHVPFEMEEDK